jgi:hypothetical protein
LDADPRNPEIAELMAYAGMLWPHDPNAGSQAIWTAWAQHLARWDVHHVRIALDALVLSRTRLPELAEIVEMLRADDAESARQQATEEARERLAAARPSFRDPGANLDAWDRGQREWADAAIAELRDFEARRTDAGKRNPEQLAAAEAALRTPGPFAQRCRALLVGEVPAGEGVDEYIAKIADAKSVRRLLHQPEPGAWDPTVHRQSVRDADAPRIQRQLRGVA